MNEKFLYNFQNTKICLQNVEKYKIVEEGINCPSDLPKKCINFCNFFIWNAWSTMRPPPSFYASSVIQEYTVNS